MAGLFDQAVAPYVGMLPGSADDPEWLQSLMRLEGLQERMGRGDQGYPVMPGEPWQATAQEHFDALARSQEDARIRSLPTGLPPEVQRAIRAGPSYGEGELMAPGQFYAPQVTPRDIMQFGGDASNGLMSAAGAAAWRDKMNMPRGEASTGVEVLGGPSPYGGWPRDEGARGYPQMRPDTSSPLLDMIRRVLAGGRQST